MKKKIKQTIRRYDVYLVTTRKGKPVSADGKRGWNYMDMLRYDSCFYHPYCKGIIIKPVRAGYSDKGLVLARWDSFSLKVTHLGSVKTVDKHEWITFSHENVTRNFLGDNSILNVTSEYDKLFAYTMAELTTYSGEEIEYVDKTSRWDAETIADLLEKIDLEKITDYQWTV
jgi:hypothetical protein